MVSLPRARDIHASLSWADALERLGVDGACLTGRHSHCPGCGGSDRFRFDDRDGRGTWICSGGGADVVAGDGFQLLGHVYGWDFKTARDRVLEIMGGATPPASPPQPQRTPPSDEPARPSRRVHDILRTSAAPESVEGARLYLDSRKLWPLPPGCELRGHAGVDYFDNGERVGRYPALLAPVRDLYGELVTVEVTYLENGKKLDRDPCRKKLSSMQGRRGCAVRLAEIDGDTLGIAEGVETALAAMRLHGVSTWAALSAGVLKRFEPPQGIHRVIVYADRDIAGLDAAWELRDRLEGQAVVERAIPSAPHGDWADVLAAREGTQ